MRLAESVRLRPAICSGRFVTKTHPRMKEKEKCTPCEANFERNIRQLVKEGEAPTPKQHHDRKQEVKAAFEETPLKK